MSLSQSYVFVSLSSAIAALCQRRQPFPRVRERDLDTDVSQKVGQVRGVAAGHEYKSKMPGKRLLSCIEHEEAVTALTSNSLIIDYCNGTASERGNLASIELRVLTC